MTCVHCIHEWFIQHVFACAHHVIRRSMSCTAKDVCTVCMCVTALPLTPSKLHDVHHVISSWLAASTAAAGSPGTKAAGTAAQPEQQCSNGCILQTLLHSADIAATYAVAVTKYHRAYIRYTQAFMCRLSARCTFKFKRAAQPCSPAHAQVLTPRVGPHCTACRDSTRQLRVTNASRQGPCRNGGCAAVPGSLPQLNR